MTLQNIRDSVESVPRKRFLAYVMVGWGIPYLVPQLRSIKLAIQTSCHPLSAPVCPRPHVRILPIGCGPISMTKKWVLIIVTE